MCAGYIPHLDNDYHTLRCSQELILCWITLPVIHYIFLILGETWTRGQVKRDKVKQTRKEGLLSVGRGQRDGPGDDPDQGEDGEYGITGPLVVDVSEHLGQLQERVRHVVEDHDEGP